MQLILGLFLVVATGCANAQQYSTSSVPFRPDVLQPPTTEPTIAEKVTLTATGAAGLPDAPSYTAQQPPRAASTLQPGRVVGVTADPHSVGVGRTPLSPLSTGLLGPATVRTTGYSSFTFVGDSGASSDKKSDGGVDSPGKNCWRNSADKADGNGWFTSLLALTSKSQHYCALGEGGFWRRGTYAATQAFVAHRYNGASSFNASEVFAGGSGSYYPYANYQGDRLAARYASAVGRDALRNMFREFWPDISTHVLHRRP